MSPAFVKYATSGQIDNIGHFLTFTAFDLFHFDLVCKHMTPNGSWFRTFPGPHILHIAFEDLYAKKWMSKKPAFLPVIAFLSSFR